MTGPVSPTWISAFRAAIQQVAGRYPSDPATAAFLSVLRVDVQDGAKAEIRFLLADASSSAVSRIMGLVDQGIAAANTGSAAPRGASVGPDPAQVDHALRSWAAGNH